MQNINKYCYAYNSYKLHRKMKKIEVNDAKVGEISIDIANETFWMKL